MSLRFPSLALVCALLLLTACDSSDPADDIPGPLMVDEDAYITTASGLQYFDAEPGTGESARPGDRVTVDYAGWLTNGTLFDSSLLPGRSPFSFTLGGNSVILGWEEGLIGMREGGVRQLVIPPSLGYGSRGSGAIPPNATIIFDVTMLGISTGTQ